MFNCPHCGESLDDEATACPYCGSDSETGWNPDVDYYSVDLPEENDSPDSTRHGPAVSGGGPHAWSGIILVLIGMAVFVWAGYSAYSWGVVLPLFFLLLCALFYILGTKREGGSGREN